MLHSRTRRSINYVIGEAPEYIRGAQVRLESTSSERVLSLEDNGNFASLDLT